MIVVDPRSFDARRALLNYALRLKGDDELTDEQREHAYNALLSMPVRAG